MKKRLKLAQKLSGENWDLDTQAWNNFMIPKSKHYDIEIGISIKLSFVQSQKIISNYSLQGDLSMIAWLNKQPIYFFKGSLSSSRQWQDVIFENEISDYPATLLEARVVCSKDYYGKYSKIQ